MLHKQLQNLIQQGRNVPLKPVRMDLVLLHEGAAVRGVDFVGSGFEISTKPYSTQMQQLTVLAISTNFCQWLVVLCQLMQAEFAIDSMACRAKSQLCQNDYTTSSRF